MNNKKLNTDILLSVFKVFLSKLKLIAKLTIISDILVAVKNHILSMFKISATIIEIAARITINRLLVANNK